MERAERSKRRGFTDTAIARAAKLAGLPIRELEARYQDARRYWLFVIDREQFDQKHATLKRNFEQAAALRKTTPKPTVRDTSFDFS